MRIVPEYCRGSKELLDLAVALVNISASAEAFERNVLALFPNAVVYQGHTHRRYTITLRPFSSQLAKTSCFYLEL